MTPDEHLAAEAAIKAKRARQAGQGLHSHRHAPTSSASRITAIVIWVLAIASLGALFYMR